VHPYRVSTSLDEQTERTRIRGGRSYLLTDPVTRTFLDALATASDEVVPFAARPILIDLTGRHPFIAYHLGMGVPISPWPLSGSDGSQRYLDHVIGQLSAGELQTAWVLDGATCRGRMAPSELVRLGQRFPDGYEELVLTHSPYMDCAVSLYRPKWAPPPVASDQRVSSEEVRLACRTLASWDAQSVHIFQGCARAQPLGCDDANPVAVLAAEPRRFTPRARH